MIGNDTGRGMRGREAEGAPGEMPKVGDALRWCLQTFFSDYELF